MLLVIRLIIGLLITAATLNEYNSSRVNERAVYGSSANRVCNIERHLPVLCRICTRCI